ncbi:hypothetical protein RJ641_028616 [Dillenia turbinata]|uniref:Translation initiation factor IF2/IF5 domain-containing protein n=1 Tax=Dillenia turbinata TaxID=194707 RepID=A0AAN8VZJ6_9MAGN
MKKQNFSAGVNGKLHQLLIGSRTTGAPRVIIIITTSDIFEDFLCMWKCLIFSSYEEGEGIVLSRYPWDGTDRDYKYDELLNRVFSILRENNPELAGNRCSTVIRPPQVLQKGTKKLVFVNFMDLCETFFLQLAPFDPTKKKKKKFVVQDPIDDSVDKLTEKTENLSGCIGNLIMLWLSCCLRWELRLVVKGRFAPKSFEGILRRYTNTILTKENRLVFLRYEQLEFTVSETRIKKKN